MAYKRFLYILLLSSLAVMLAFPVISCSQEPPSIVLFSAMPSEINSGALSTLKWNVTDAASVTIDQGVGEVSANGSKELSPSKTTAYTLTAINAGGTVTRSVVLYVTEPPPPPSTPAVDTIPPVIKNVSTSSETETGAVITWTTNELATSGIEYGKETDYGLTASSTKMTTDHSLTLSNLSPNTAYHFQVTSSDEAGNQSASADNIFVTAQEKSTYSLAILSLEWGRRQDSTDMGLGGTTPVAGKKYLYIKGSLQNKSRATLHAIICTMNCWSGGTIVKYEVYVYRGPSLPGQVFSFDIQTADDPTVDNVTIDFADSTGKEIVPTKQY